jgi:tetratricopeptide (TPR) repeat protein
LTADTLSSLRIAANRVTRRELGPSARATGVHKALADAAAKAGETASLGLESALTYASAADKAWRAGEPREAERYLAVASKTARTLGQDSPDAAFRKYELLDAIAAAHLANNPSEARAAYVESARMLDTYLTTFRLATPSRTAPGDNSTIVSWLGNLSFKYMLGGDSQRAITAAEKALASDPTQAWIEANLAHGLLLSGKEDEAIVRYMKVRNGKLGSRSIVDATSEDFQIFRKLGLDHALMDSILAKMAAP